MGSGQGSQRISLSRGLVGLGTDSSLEAHVGGAQNDNVVEATGLGHSGGLVFFLFPFIPDSFIAAMRIDQSFDGHIGVPEKLSVALT